MCKHNVYVVKSETAVNSNMDFAEKMKMDFAEKLK